jgi:hypothetical protein
LLVGSKNIGTTHITNGAYRLHHVEWHIGEAVGCAISFCLRNKLMPRQLRNNKDKLQKFQKNLENEGIPLHWTKAILEQKGKI